MPYRLDYSCPVKSSHTTKNVLTPGVSLRSGKGVKLMQAEAGTEIFSVFHQSENCSENVLMTKYERIFNFNLCVYLAYFRSYGHFKIVKCIGMY